MIHIIKLNFLLVLVAFYCQNSIAQIDITYQLPDKAIMQLADASPPPLVYRDNNADWMVMLYRPAFKSIEEVAAREYRLAGLRINAKNNGPSRSRYYNKITILDVKSGAETDLKGLPDKVLISNFNWSPDFKKFAFTITEESGIALWYGVLENSQATRLTDPVLNDVFRGNPYMWTPDSKSLICKIINKSSGSLIHDDRTPSGPIVQQNLGKKAPARTYQDLLKNKDDEENFTFLTTSQLKKVDLNGVTTDFRDPGIYLDMSFSPDGNYIMLTSIHSPYSYMVPYYRFPRKTAILSSQGKDVKVLNDSPLEEERPKGFMATSKGPRDFGWRADQPSTVYWAQALDGGDPAVAAEYRDAIYTLKAPFSGEGGEMIKLQQRFYHIQWSNGNLAMVTDYWWNTRNRKVYQFKPDYPREGLRLVFDINTEDRYKLPGSFAMELNKYGKDVLLLSKNNRTLYLTGLGYSPEGNKPFVDAFDIKTIQAQLIWQADGISTYERVIEILSINKGEILTSLESPTENPNYYIRNIYKNTAPKRITNFLNPNESLEGVTKEMLQYKRDDGTDLTAILYLPAGYDKEKDGRLPVLLWAYPREFKDAKAAGQVKDSPHRFITISYGSPIFWVNRGYAVMDRTDFPIIGEGDDEPNDTFIEQLVANGKAAVGVIDDMGIADPNRVGVGGHSYGAFFFMFVKGDTLQS